MTPTPVVVRVENASKRFIIHKEKSLKERLVNFGRSQANRDDFWALKDVNLEFEAGTTVGLIGPNGSGKSTLLKLLGGILQPTTGTVEHRGRLAALLELGAGFHPDLTGRENVYLNASILGLSVAQTNKYFDAIVAFSGIEQFIDTQVKFYSSGMYVRLAFAVAVHVDPDVLLVDEVLAVGDEPFQRKCMDRIRQFQADGRTIILVTHSLDQVADLCDRAVVLENGKVQVDGDPVDALRHLRADFEVIRQADSEQVITTSTAPAPTAAVTGVTVLDTDGNPTTTLVSGGAIDVQVDLQNTGEPIPSPMVGMLIETSLGQIAYGTNSKLLGGGMPPLDGRQRFVFHLSELPLVEGTYGITAAVGLDSGIELHRLSHAVTLEVRGTGRTIGFLDIGTQLTQVPALEPEPDESATELKSVKALTDPDLAPLPADELIEIVADRVSDRL